MERTNLLYWLIFILALLLVIFFSTSMHAQEHPDFTIEKQVKTSSVKSQGSTGTCWSYATTSFIETEALRLGKEELDLAEMFFARMAYTDKAIKYVRVHGMGNFSQGGQAHDVTNVIRRFGIVPQEAYQALEYGETKHMHSEMEAVLKGVVDAVVQNKNKRLSTAWLRAFNSVLDAYLGVVPQQFDYKGESYTPSRFAKEVVGFISEDYVELTSYSCYPMYELVDLEVPDNWSHDRYYNVPMDELMQTIDYALSNGFSVDWDGDVSEKSFSHKKGRADLSERDASDMSKMGIAVVRQFTFDNLTSTDDHLMHLTGIAKDKNQKTYYLTKNSWGDSNDYDGYLYMSDDFLQIKTIAIFVHKDAIPKALAKKLGVK